MTATPSAPPTRRPAPVAPASQAPSTGPRFAMAQPNFDPPRIVLNAVEGWGKTSFVAHAPGAAIVMARGETGYSTLLGAGRVPQIPVVGIETWPDLLALIDGLIVDPQGCKVLGLDAMGGFERMCHEVVCKRDFKGDWGERGFGSFQKGYDVAVGDWLNLLSRLDQLRRAQGTTIVLLSHAKIKNFKNPMGPDYDRYNSDVHDKTWAVTAKWADAVFFGTFESVIEGGEVEEKGKRGKKGKGMGVGGLRRLYTERRDAFDAKNRYGMEADFLMPEVPAETWGFVWSKINPKQ